MRSMVEGAATRAVAWVLRTRLHPRREKCREGAPAPPPPPPSAVPLPRCAGEEFRGAATAPLLRGSKNPPPSLCDGGGGPCGAWWRGRARARLPIRDILLA